MTMKQTSNEKLDDYELEELLDILNTNEFQ
jgi:hypothetical protein